MKKIILLFAVFLGFFSIAQENSPEKFDITKSEDYSYLKTKIDLTDIHSEADVLPQYPGGINAFRKNFAEIFDPSILEERSGTTLKTTAYFIIEKDGSVNNLIAVGDKQYSKLVEKALKKIKTTWKPAIINGEPVRYLFRFPLTMSF